MPAASKKDAIIEARRLLGNCVLFEGLSDSERSAISARARMRTFDAGENIFAIGSPGDQMMAVLSGSVRISVPSNDGKELLLAIIHPGEVFGELAVLDGKERSADALAEPHALWRSWTVGTFCRSSSAIPPPGSKSSGLVSAVAKPIRSGGGRAAAASARLAKMMLRVTSTIPSSRRENPLQSAGTREHGGRYA